MNITYVQGSKLIISPSGATIIMTEDTIQKEKSKLEKIITLSQAQIDSYDNDLQACEVSKAVQ